MNCILIGCAGQIGDAIYNVYSPYHTIHGIDLEVASPELLDEYDIMLVTIPYSDSFVEIISQYQQRFKTKAKIIFSTVAIGTTSKLRDAVHVPIEGKHPNLTESIKQWQVFMGGFNQLVYNFFVQSAKSPYIIEKPEHTEFLKLQSTTYYGVVIEYIRYLNSVTTKLGMDFSKVNEYNNCYNDLYAELQEFNYKRYLLYPPEGAKGGHCVVPNSKLLGNQFKSIFTDIVSEVTNVECD
jgi:hypothetical protein